MSNPHLLTIAAADYGAFAPLVAITSAIMAAGGAIIVLWAGPLEKWRPPDADLPGMTKRIIFLVCSVLMVLLALDATPETLGSMKAITWTLVPIGVVLAIIYSAARFGLYKTRLNSQGTERTLFLGGLWLRPEAKAIMKQKGLHSIEDLLDGSPGPEALWSGISRFCARVLVLSTFILFVVIATSSLLEAGLIVYVKTTGKALLRN